MARKAHVVTAHLEDTPYVYVKKLSPIEIELAYGDIHERWLKIPTPRMHHSSYRIEFNGSTYCFAGQLRGER